MASGGGWPKDPASGGAAEKVSSPPPTNGQGRGFRVVARLRPEPLFRLSRLDPGQDSDCPLTVPRPGGGTTLRPLSLLPLLVAGSLSACDLAEFPSPGPGPPVSLTVGTPGPPP